MTQYGLTQIIHEPTHLLDCSSSCIDLIFTFQNDLVTNSGVHSCLHSNCHHQIIFSRFNLKFHYLPPYERVVWEYDKADKDLITKAIDAFDWDKKLSEKYVNDQVLLLNETLRNIMSNFIPNKLMIFDDRKSAWFDRKIKNLIKYKNQIFKDTHYRKSNHNFQFHFRYIQNLINTNIDQGKRKYCRNISRQLSDKSLNPKNYWPLLKTLLNGKKTLFIPPLHDNNKFISEIKAKCELFSSDFAEQCTPLVNNCQLSTRFTTHTDSRSVGRVVWWLATCARKSKVPGSGPAASYVQKWALRSNRPANV